MNRIFAWIKPMQFELAINMEGLYEIEALSVL